MQPNNHAIEFYRLIETVAAGFGSVEKVAEIEEFFNVEKEAFSGADRAVKQVTK